jgi:predicted amidophosphoribosyltransferase
MSDVFLVLLILGILALAGGVLVGGVLNKVVHSRKDCPLCWQSIPADAMVCPKCKAKL